MNQYVTASVIKKLRENKNLTQLDLAQILNVSDKTVSKWETGRGYPDISFLESISSALGISVIELLSGENITNTNKASNMNKMKFYVCPVCANMMCTSGSAVISCCGITLPALETEEKDDKHVIDVQLIDDEIFVKINHEMSKSHYISFIAYVRQDSFEVVKLYPQQDAQACFFNKGKGKIFAYCNHHGLFCYDFCNRKN